MSEPVDIQDCIEICKAGAYPPIAWSLEIAKRLSIANVRIAELEQELHTATERADKAEHRACVLDHPKGHYDTRDEIEMFLRDAYASGCNAARSHSLLTAMEYAEREAPKLRELLRVTANPRIAELEKNPVPQPAVGAGLPEEPRYVRFTGVEIDDGYQIVLVQKRDYLILRARAEELLKENERLRIALAQARTEGK